MDTLSNYKAGFVNILGKPNVGKSTLMNALLGERLSIMTPKVQTTRHRIFGILNVPEYQIVFSDTPGIIQPHYGMQKSMMHFVKETFEDADVFLYVAEIGDSPEKQPDEFAKMLLTGVPTMIVLNKTDKLKNEVVLGEVVKWQAIAPEATILPASAKEKINLDVLLDFLIQHMPVCPPYFDKDALTDKSERFFVTEIIREKILMLYKEEIPYSCEVGINSFKDEPEIARISAEIYVNRKSQKPIIIGKGGEMIKKLGIESRLHIEEFLQKKVYLELHVKVLENWRDNEKVLKQLGY